MTKAKKPATQPKAKMEAAPQPEHTDHIGATPAPHPFEQQLRDALQRIGETEATVTPAGAMDGEVAFDITIPPVENAQFPHINKVNWAFNTDPSVNHHWGEVFDARLKQGLNNLREVMLSGMPQDEDELGAGQTGDMTTGDELIQTRDVPQDGGADEVLPPAVVTLATQEQIAEAKAAPREPTIGDAVLFWPSTRHQAEVKPAHVTVTTRWSQVMVNLSNGAGSVRRVDGSDSDLNGYCFAYADEVDADAVTARLQHEADEHTHDRAVAGHQPIFQLEVAKRLPLAIDGGGDPVGKQFDSAIQAFQEGEGDKAVRYEVVHVKHHGLAKRRI